MIVGLEVVAVSLGLFGAGIYWGGVICMYSYAGPLLTKKSLIHQTGSYEKAKPEYKDYMKNCRQLRLASALMWVSDMTEHDMMLDD